MDPPFCSMVRASGLGEIWTHNHDDLKFGQFGWRCTNKENSYGTECLIGNWNEERFDIEKQKQAKRLPSQYEHYFETTYGSSYDRTRQGVPETINNLKERHSYAFPGHQPELDSPGLKSEYNSWQTTSRAAFLNPGTRKTPLEQPAEQSQ